MSRTVYVKVTFTEPYRGSQDVDNALDSFLGEGRYKVIEIPKPVIPPGHDQAVTAAYKLVDAYEAGLRNGGSVDWEDVNIAWRWATRATRAIGRAEAKARKGGAT
jgi:hypothetical protein